MESPDKTTLHIVRLADLPASNVFHFDVTPTAKQIAGLQATLGVDALRKLRIHGTLSPIGKRDWDLSARIGATVVQPCVVSFAPVTTRIETAIGRLYLADLPDLAREGEVEMPEDDRMEQLPAEIDLFEILTEELSLSVPAYPRADNAALAETVFTEPGKAPMQDKDARPFAALADLRDALGKTSEDDD